MKMLRHWLAIVLAVVAAASCSSGGGEEAVPEVDATRADVTADGAAGDVAGRGAADASGDMESGETVSGPSERIIAMGDLHGDLEAGRRAFKVAGLIDDHYHWIGGTAVVVQTGDVLDRWYLERELMDWLVAVRAEALAAGGDIITLAGNHEQMNLEEYYPDVDPDSCPAYQDLPDDITPVSAEVIEKCRKRAASLLPGGTYAMVLAEKRVAVIVGDSAFVHGGLRPEHVSSPADIDDMNVRWGQFARGEAGKDVDEDIYESMWDRSYSDDDVEPDCAALETVLASLGVSRMVVGHSRWSHINSACDGKVWRIDTGMSEYYGGNIEVLEITDSGTTPLAE